MSSLVFVLLKSCGETVAGALSILDMVGLLEVGRQQSSGRIPHPTSLLITFLPPHSVFFLPLATEPLHSCGFDFLAFIMCGTSHLLKRHCEHVSVSVCL